MTKARDILCETPLIDGHNDLPWQYRKRVDNHIASIDLSADTSTLDPPLHTDIARLRRGHVGAQFWAIYVPSSYEGPGAARILFEQIDVTRRLIARYPDTFALATCADEIMHAFSEGKIASVLAVEGGHAIENSLAVLRQAYAAGARYMTLTHNDNIAWADSATDEPRIGGLSAFGKEVVREMNRLGMMVDLSHTAPATMHDALDESEAPVLFSHAGARAVCDHPRNVPDDVLMRVHDCDGLVMATFVPPFVSVEARDHRYAWEAERRGLVKEDLDEDEIERRGEAWLADHPAPRATLQQVADHIDHLREVMGVDHVGIGSDFDGITMVPRGLEDVSKFPDLLTELLHRGYSADDVAKIAGRNLLRLMYEVEAAGERIDATRDPSEARIEELDGDGKA
jgi:membrane dipeptidase